MDWTFCWRRTRPCSNFYPNFFTACFAVCDAYPTELAIWLPLDTSLSFYELTISLGVLLGFNRSFLLRMISSNVIFFSFSGYLGSVLLSVTTSWTWCLSLSYLSFSRRVSSSSSLRLNSSTAANFILNVFPMSIYMWSFILTMVFTRLVGATVLTIVFTACATLLFYISAA